MSPTDLNHSDRIPLDRQASPRSRLATCGRASWDATTYLKPRRDFHGFSGAIAIPFLLLEVLGFRLVSVCMCGTCQVCHQLLTASECWTILLRGPIGKSVPIAKQSLSKLSKWVMFTHTSLQDVVLVLHYVALHSGHPALCEISLSNGRRSPIDVRMKILIQHVVDLSTA